MFRTALAAVAVASVPACNVILGLDAYIDCPEDPSCPKPDAGAGGATSTTSSTTTESGGTGGMAPAPTCTDGSRNGNETGVDCGGGACPACPDGEGCMVGPDCTSIVCKGNVCIAPKCNDLVKNGDETDEDCGGAKCAPCADGKACVIDGDCESALCANGACITPTTWAKLFGDAASQGLGALATDALGNTYIAGVYDGTITFPPTSTLTASGSDVYLAKLDPQGKALWSKTFAATGTVHITGMAIDALGAVGVVGDITGSINFGDGAVYPTFDAVVGFAAIFEDDGVLRWSAGLNDGDPFRLGNIAFDSAGNVLFLASNNCHNCIDGGQIWLQKRTPSGNILWYKFLYGASLTVTEVGGLAVDPFDDILIGGAFTNSLDLGGGSMTSAGGWDAFVARLHGTNGNIWWQKRYGDAADQHVTDIRSDSDGNIALLGSFAGDITFGAAHTSAGGNDIFLAKMSTGGTPLWSRSFGDANEQQAARLVVDAANNIVFTGGMSGSVDFGGGALSGGGGIDIPLVKIQSDGTFLWSKVFGDGANQAGAGVGMMPDGDVILGGSVLGSIDIDTGPLTSAGQTDVFVAKIAP